MTVEYGQCVRGRQCVDAQRATGEDGRAVYVGATCTSALCDTCVRYLRYALAALPLDVAELSDHAVPSMAVRYREPDMPAPTRVKLHAPLPLDGSALALQSLIDHEVTSWAASVAASARVAWDDGLAAASRQLQRVHNGCQLLAYRVEWLLALPPVRHRVRSAGERITDGWPLEALDRMEADPVGDWWISRDGTEGALTLLDLHAQVEGFVGRASGDRAPIPCPKCERRALVREHRSGRVTCRYCWREMRDADYEALVARLSDLFGVPR